MSQSSKQKPIGTYVDTVRAQMENDAGSFIIYAVESLNSEGKGAGISNQARVSAAPTLPPPADLQARVTGQGVVLSWTAASLPPMAGVRYVYRVYRHPEGISALALAGEIPIEADRQFVLTDSTIEWQKIYLYHAEAVTIIDQQNQAQLQVEGDDTAEIKVFADNVFPPAVPTGLQTVFSGPGQQTFIDLVWAPVTDLDLAGYNVYRHEQAGAPTKLNPEPIKAPAYRDANVASGRRYVYSVSAVDIRGNESVASEEASESVP